MLPSQLKKDPEFASPAPAVQPEAPAMPRPAPVHAAPPARVVMHSPGPVYEDEEQEADTVRADERPQGFGVSSENILDILVEEPERPAPARPAEPVPTEAAAPAAPEEEPQPAPQAEEPAPQAEEPAAPAVPPHQMTLEPEPEIEPLQYIGEAFKTYIITQRGQELCLIDKHAAHERILFEELAKDYGHVSSQMLLAPVTVTLSAEEKVAILGNRQMLMDAGVEAEDFGGSTVLVRAVPADVGVEDVEDLLVELAAKLARGSKDAYSEQTEWVLHSIACRAAIKAGDRTPPQQLMRLAEEILAGKVPPFCPHGRPVVLKLTKKELEKQFGRIV